METPEVFNRYDIRGKYPEEIDEDFAFRLGKSIGKYIKEEALAKEVCVGRDTREGSRKLMEALVDGTVSMGIDVYDVGIGPTDKVSIIGSKKGCGASVMVTASHHCWKRSGFKLLYEQGHGFNNGDLGRVKEIYMEEPESKERRGEIKKVPEADEIYEREVMGTFKKYFDGIDSRVIVDCCNGGAAALAPKIMRGLGADVVELNSSKTVDRSLEPEPKKDNRRHLREKISTEEAEIVVGYDPDADRVFAIDKDGEWINGDEIFCILGKIVQPKTAVASIDTSGMLEETLDSKIHYTRVGDIFVSERGIEEGADLLGEPNGHYAITEHSWYNSGLFASLLMSAVAGDIPQMKRNLPDYISENITSVQPNQKVKKERMGRIKEYIRSEECYRVISEVDGIKFTEKGCSCLIRPSGTSPKIRAKIEGKDKKDVSRLKNKIKDTLQLL